MDAILQVRDLHRSFGGVKATDGVSFDVARGSITGLIGPNGAGKTTLFNLIAGTLKPSSGRILLEGVDITGWRPDRLAQIGLIRTFQLARGLAQLSVVENFALYARSQPGETLWRGLLGDRATRRREAEIIAEAWRLIHGLNLATVANNRAADLSGGQRKLVELGRALLGGPKLLLLDEPTAGVNPALAVEIADLLLGIRDRGITILVVEHNMGFVRRICDRVIALASARVLAEGDFESIRANADVQAAYFGTVQ